MYTCKFSSPNPAWSTWPIASGRGGERDEASVCTLCRQSHLCLIGLFLLALDAAELLQYARYYVGCLHRRLLLCQALSRAGSERHKREWRGTVVVLPARRTEFASIGTPNHGIAVECGEAGVEQSTGRREYRSGAVRAPSGWERRIFQSNAIVLGEDGI